MINRNITLTRHIYIEQQAHSSATGKLSALLAQVGYAAKMVAQEIGSAGLGNLLGKTGEVNVQGEEVQRLDRFGNDAFIQAFGYSGLACTMISEEMEKPLHFPENCKEGKYVLLVDPIDGSSNIDVNGPIGSIFSFYKRIENKKHGTKDELLRKGSEQVAAGYVLYGPSTILVYTAGAGVHGFTLHSGIGEFLLSHERIRMPKKGKVYSVNEGNANRWKPEVRQFVNFVRQEDKNSGFPYSGRYIGSLVADFHRTLLEGGVFLYPSTSDKPQGKLRLLYECSPLAFIAEQAGGSASTGKGRILNVRPDNLHQRTPLFIGSSDDVALAEDFIQGRKYFG
jgi:fructose-1,6-bisphosphatase I